jgi:glutamate racemase
MIGILDSGLGGLTTLNYLRLKHPEVSFLALADQKNAPYGDKHKEEVLEITRKNLEWFQGKGIKQVIVACNTLCSTVLEELKPQFPELELVNIVDLTIDSLKKEKISSLLIIGTKLCIASGVYENRLKEYFPHAKISSLATPKFAMQIEEGKDPETIQQSADDYLKDYRGKVEALLLGCTHYPLIGKEIYHSLPVKQYDANKAIEEHLEFKSEKDPKILIYTSGKPEETQKQIKQLFNFETEVRYKDR